MSAPFCVQRSKYVFIVPARVLGRVVAHNGSHKLCAQSDGQRATVDRLPPVGSSVGAIIIDTINIEPAHPAAHLSVNVCAHETHSRRRRVCVCVCLECVCM